MTSILNTNDTCLKAFPRHSGQGVFLIFRLRSAAGAPRRGWWYSSYLIDREVKILELYLNTTIFIGNAQSQAKRSRGFTPAAVASPKYDKSRTGNTSLLLSAGAGGTGFCPLLHRTSALYFIYGKRNFTELSIQIKKNSLS